MIELRDPQALRAYLHHDLAAHAYQLGDLDPMFFKFTRWFATKDEADQLKSLVLIYNGLRLPAVLTSGEADGVQTLLENIQPLLPEGFLYHLHEHHLAALHALHPTAEPKPMMRMALQRADFTPPPDTSGVTPLGHRDTGALMRLYAFYPDHFFEPFQLDSGLYFGIHRDNQLVSVAGIHAISDRDGVAAIGNILTHPNYRGQGLSGKCTSTLLTHLFKRVALATLNVLRDNTPALHSFERLGFRTHRVFYEGRINV